MQKKSLHHKTEKANRLTTDSFWSGTFGDEYTQRNSVDFTLRIPFFESILSKVTDIHSVCEVGANQGHNLDAIHQVDHSLTLTGIEINTLAYQTLSSKPHITGIHSSVQQIHSSVKADLIISCGVLIHLSPQDLPGIYNTLMQMSNRYILLNEYFSTQPVEVNYRGHHSKLYKRDFASELINHFPQQLTVLDYGFLWHRTCPTWDDMTWFLLEKNQNVR